MQVCAAEHEKIPLDDLAQTARLHDDLQRFQSTEPLGHRDEIDGLLGEPVREWNIERTMEANVSTLAFAGVALGATVDRRWLALPVLVTARLSQHSVQGRLQSRGTASICMERRRSVAPETPAAELVPLRSSLFLPSLQSVARIDAGPVDKPRCDLPDHVLDRHHLQIEGRHRRRHDGAHAGEGQHCR